MIKQHDKDMPLQNYSVWDDDDGVPPSTPYECKSCFRRFTDFAMAKNNLELLIGLAKWQ